jgi:YtfJ family uncharacterized protein
MFSHQIGGQLALVLALYLGAGHLTASASNPEVGTQLPDLSIKDRGELLLQDDEVSYRPWSYPQQTGKVHIVQYMAATKTAGDLHKPFRDRLDTDLPANSFETTTILNMDEAIWGTGGFVVNQLKSNKQKYPKAVMVLDEEGLGVKRWALNDESAALIIVDQQGTVRYVKQGQMSAAEVDSTLQLILGFVKQQAL